MDKRKLKKAGAVVITMSVLSASAAATVYAYKSDFSFKPPATDRELQINQIVFSQDKDGFNTDNNRGSDSGELWKKDTFADESLELGRKSNYFFESLLSIGNSNFGLGISEQGNSAQGASNGSDNIYNLVDDENSADVVINTGSTDKYPNEENGDGNTGGNGSNEEPAEPDIKPSDDKTSGGSTSKPETKPDTPSNPSDTIKEPEPEKQPPTSLDSNPKPYEEGIISGSGNSYTVIIGPAYSWGSDCLYKGQTVTAEMVYNTLDTYVTIGNKVYYWDTDDYNKYIRVDALSFDNGQTWISDFPITIPKDMDTLSLKIRVSYRIRLNDKWISEDFTYTMLKESRILVLSESLPEDAETISPSIILNNKESQYVAAGATINLLSSEMQGAFLNYGPLNSLFPGWKENGQFVPWIYTADTGRHILEPAESIPLDENFHAELQLFFLQEELGLPYIQLCYMQTLTGIEAQAKTSYRSGSLLQKLTDKELVVPQYIQAINFDETEEVSVDYLTIPDTVLYIEESSGLTVKKGFKVDKKNLYYSSNAEGLLLNREGTQILAVPYGKEEITIPSKVTSIKFPQNGRIKRISLEASSEEEIPDFIGSLHNCTVKVREELLVPLFSKYSDIFDESGTNRVAVLSDKTDTTYAVKNGAIVSSKGSLEKVLADSKASLTLSNKIMRISDFAFEDAFGLETLILPKDGHLVTLDENSLTNSVIKNIYCYSKQQYKTVQAALEKNGLSDMIGISLIRSENGFQYVQRSVVDESGQNTDIYVLLSVPNTVINFDGTIRLASGETVTVNEVGDYAFQNCTELVWVTLPEKVKRIGEEAFSGCTSLQGVFLDSRDQITIGNNAFSSCDSLRFIASNAMSAVMEENYEPEITDGYGSSINPNEYFFAPTNSIGYPWTAISFTSDSAIDEYRLIELDENNKVLYGVTCSSIGEDNAWLAIRSGLWLGSEVHLPSSTKEIFNYAFADTMADASQGNYTINWESLPRLQHIDIGGFRSSRLSGDVNISNNGFHVYDNAFCETQITSVELTGYNLNTGENSFGDCKELVSAVFGSFKYDATLYAGCFTGCDNLTEITFTAEDSLPLAVYMALPFRFNYDRTAEEEAEMLKINIPDGSLNTYIKKWRYSFLGYGDVASTSAYQAFWNYVESDLIDYENWVFPQEEEVDEEVSRRLTETENYLRSLLGKNEDEKAPVSEPTDFYPYRTTYDAFFSLIGAPSYVTDVIISGETLGLPKGWIMDYISTGAFSNSPNLKSVTITEPLVGIYADAFKGVEGDLTLTFTGKAAEITALLDTCEDGTFGFGIDDSKMHVIVDGDEKVQEDFLNFWTLQLAGYSDLDVMREEMSEEEIREVLFKCENRVRLWMGLELLASPDDVTQLLTQETFESGSEESTPQDIITEDDTQIGETEREDM